jgi:predicted transposase YbfD/YdcC
LRVFSIEPMEANFPYARSLVVMRTERTEKKSGKTTRDPHYYLSSLPPDHFEAAQWLDLIRGHWGGVEIRNHWRRDALMGEDGSRSRKPKLLANMALIRSTLLATLADKDPERPLPALMEDFARKPAQTLSFLRS